MIPILVIVFDRLEYTKKVIAALEKCEDVEPIIIDNGSSPKTVEWLKFCCGCYDMKFNETNIGIAGAMNQFLEATKFYPFVGKVDNDTIVPPNFIEKMLPHLEKADIVQAKHKLIEASKVGTFDEWTSKMPKDGALRFNHFVGGSGILFKRKLVNHIPETEDKLQGWRQFQREHPELKKAFATDVEIELLDQDGYPQEYENYYKATGRI